jgi:hypothetical protein
MSDDFGSCVSMLDLFVSNVRPGLRLPSSFLRYVEPACCSVEDAFRRAVEGDRRIGRVPAHEVDDAFEELELILRPADAAADAGY